MHIANDLPKSKAWRLPITELRADMAAVPLDVAGFYFTVLAFELACGEPLPSRDAVAALYVEADVRSYRRLVGLGLKAGLLQRAQDGRLSARSLSSCRPVKDRTHRAGFPDDTRSVVLRKTNGVCTYCAVKLETTVSRQPTSFEVDHVLPVALGGTDDIANLVPACRSCNSKKIAKTALRFMGGADVA